MKINQPSTPQPTAYIPTSTQMDRMVQEELVRRGACGQEVPVDAYERARAADRCLHPTLLARQEVLLLSQRYSEMRGGPALSEQQLDSMIQHAIDLAHPAEYAMKSGVAAAAIASFFPGPMAALGAMAGAVSVSASNVISSNHP